MAIARDYLFECLMYVSDVGVFVWRERPRSHFKREMDHKTWNTKHAGKEAGNLSKVGYWRIGIDYKVYQAHRLAWFFMKGVWPKFIDHVNGIRTDNKFENLRDVTQKENNQNMAMSTRNSSGYVGVYWDKACKKWCARIGSKYIGVFKNLDEAVLARKKAEANQGFHPNHGRLKSGQ